MTSTVSLEAARRYAAECSGGKSSEAIYGAILKAVADFDLRGSVLDFGAGVGSLTRLLQQCECFSPIAAADLMPKPADLESVWWICADLNNPLPVARETFDAVIVAEVIEHLENPRALARELFRILKPGGTAIVSTPNNESWRSVLSLLVRGHYVAFCDGSYPAHITALLRKDIERIFCEAGFYTPHFIFSDCGGIPGKPIVSWQDVSAGLLKGVRFSDNVITICRKPSPQGER